jgi:predicted peptidase
MRKTLFSLLMIFVCVGMVSSCRKTSVLPTPVDGDPNPTHPSEGPPAKLDETEPPVLTPVTFDISTNIKGYYKSLPARYAESTEKYPVIIYFHGGGQYGNGSTDLPMVLEEGIPKLISEKKFPPSFSVDSEKFSFIVVAPQFTEKVGNDQVQKLVQFVKDSFRIDTKRIYLAGLSLGSRVLSDYAAYRPTEIAAITAMAGAPQIDDNLNAKCTAMVNAELPVWQFHNRDDSAWYYSEARRYMEVFNSLNPVIPAKFTTFEVGTARLHHDCWTKGTDPAYKEDGKNIYEWMLQYTR